MGRVQFLFLPRFLLLGVLGYDSMKFWDFPDISEDRKPYVVRQLVGQLLYTMFIMPFITSFHLWWKENLLKYPKLSKYCDHDCTYHDCTHTCSEFPLRHQHNNDCWTTFKGIKFCRALQKWIFNLRGVFRTLPNIYDSFLWK